MSLDVRVIESPASAEVYITASPSPGAPAARQAAEVFADIRNALTAAHARILEERVFATERSLETIRPIRARAYGELDDGVPPTQLVVPAGGMGELAGVQVHAVRCDRAPEPLRLGESVCGRRIKLGQSSYVAVSGLSAPEAGMAAAQARKMFEKAESVLRQVGADMHSVARTWVWLDDILSWYDEFNGVRNRFFVEHGLLNGSTRTGHPPASTGIGVSLAGRPRCGLDLVAICGEPGCVRHYSRAGHQNPPYQYGSAFSRASKAATPAGGTVFVSGTAAIDDRGITQHVGDVAAQIEATIGHVRAVLQEMSCTDADVVQAIAYSKTVEAEKAFRARQRNLSWPCLSVIADVCRHELLFEIEATACPGARAIASIA